MILYINACVRSDSRTDVIARALLNKLGRYDELKLSGLDIRPLDEALLQKRTDLIGSGNYDDPMFDLSKQFASADAIVISAPFWDGSFPAILKTYLENIYVTGIVSKYSKDGTPVGLCKAAKLYYVTTAGGPYFPDFSYGYISVLAVQMFGITETELLYSENLDIFGNDPDLIIKDTIHRYGLD